MPNAWKVEAGDNVSYLQASPTRWRVAKVTSVITQSSLVLAIRGSDGSLSTLGTVPKKTTGTETNVWRPY